MKKEFLGCNAQVCHGFIYVILVCDDCCTYRYRDRYDALIVCMCASDRRIRRCLSSNYSQISLKESRAGFECFKSLKKIPLGITSVLHQSWTGLVCRACLAEVSFVGRYLRGLAWIPEHLTQQQRHDVHRAYAAYLIIIEYNWNILMIWCTNN